MGLSVPDDPPLAELSRNRLWNQSQAAEFLAVTPRYLRDCSCPRILLPGNGPSGRPVLRYDPDEVRAWARAWRTGESLKRRRGS